MSTNLFLTLSFKGYIFKFKGICRARDNPEEARRFFEMAIEKFEEGLSGDPNNIHTLRNYAQSLSLLGALSNSTELTARALEVYRYGPKGKKAIDVLYFYLLLST